ncbi:uncharacterized protein RHO25_013201 [Cercospora beticola]|uniref:Uncharacterized protein n=1 Tax=Cercospora beticola TaxID=122368 RepID=A0ABZ0PAH3_CERBT|nr:hypothetical protein RHO25_013201 [Cercospora beticola]
MTSSIDQAEILELQRKIDVLEFDIQGNHTMLNQEQCRRLQLEEHIESAKVPQDQKLQVQQKRLGALQHQVDHQRMPFHTKEFFEIEELKSDLRSMQQNYQGVRFGSYHGKADTHVTKYTHSMGYLWPQFCWTAQTVDGDFNDSVLKRAANALRCLRRWDRKIETNA